MRDRQLKDGTDRHDPGGIYGVVRHVVVAFDVLKIHCFGDARLLVEVHQVTLQISIIENAATAAFDGDVIDAIDENHRAKEPPMGLPDAGAKQLAGPSSKP